ncbi:hypothetical protein VTP01DRAFT_2800 [Rhizomucor pusillus]|uniref:uncharacterized protein n=1 Tax=Rhizomucor pusillus TaxID=4840 RepID=UPI003743EE80
MSNLNTFQDYDKDFVQNRGDPYYDVDEDAEFDPSQIQPADQAQRTGRGDDLNQGVDRDEDLDEITDTDQMLSNRFRDTTQQKAGQQGLYNEDRLYGEGEPAKPRAYDDRDIENRVRSEVAASHRQDRSKESRQASAKRASDMYQKVVGEPLEVDEQGRVVTE